MIQHEPTPNAPAIVHDLDLQDLNIQSPDVGEENLQLQQPPDVGEEDILPLQQPPNLGAHPPQPPPEGPPARNTRYRGVPQIHFTSDHEIVHPDI